MSIYSEGEMLPDGTEKDFKFLEPNPPDKKVSLNGQEFSAWMTSLLAGSSAAESADSYGLNRQKPIVSHSARSVHESRLEDHELARQRDIVVDRIKRSLQELQDVDEARADIAAKIARYDARHAPKA